MMYYNYKRVKGWVYVKRSFLYLGYVIMCLAISYMAALVKIEISLIVSKTYHAGPGAFAIFGIYMILGIMWAGERVLAGRVRMLEMILVRGLALTVSFILCLGMFVVDGVFPYDIYGSGTMPVMATICGYLIFSSIEIVNKKKFD